MDFKLLCSGIVVLSITTLIIGEVQARELLDLDTIQRAAYFTTNHDFTGFIASLTVYDHNIKGGQMTSSYISIQSNANEEIAAGWMVDPWKYGDSRTRFFVHWRGFRCPNNECHNEFVSKEGSYLAHGDILDTGNHMTIKFLKDANTGDWRLYVGANADFLSEIGYFPKSLFTQLAVQANHAEFGGAVKFLASMKSPPMGNGVFANDDIPGGQPTPAMMTDVFFVRPDGQFEPINTYNYILGKLNCYGLGKSTVTDRGSFAYGGPGGCSS